MLKKLFIAVLGFVSFAASAQGFKACPQNFVNGVAPQVAASPEKRLRELCFDGFAVLHSGQTKTPVFSAEYMSRDSLKKAYAIPRVDKFYEEARLPFAERALLRDYKGSGWDRGHMFAAAAAPTHESSAQSFSLANMIPQAPKLNQGIWAKDVEAATRKYAERSAKGIYVYTGPIYGANSEKIGPGKVWVPQTVFKLVYDPAKNTAWAYVLPNTKTVKMKAPVSYEELVRLTGIRFLPDNIKPEFRQ